MVRQGIAAFLALLANGCLAVATDNPAALPDPMAPPPGAQAAPKQETTEPAERVTYRLQGVKIEPRRKTAVINGQMVTTGDTVDGATVESIEPEGVVLQSGDVTTTLRLLKNEVKQRSRVAH